MSDDERKLTIRERKFVAALATGQVGNATEAVVAAGYKPADNNTARNMAYQIMKRPHIQKAMSEAIQRKFPDIPSLGADVLYGILQDPEERSVVKLKALEYLMKLFGWQAPSRSQHLTAQVDVTDLTALPGEDDETQ